MGIRPGRPGWDLDGLDASGGEQRVEGGDEFRIPVADQESESVAVLVEDHQQVTGDLGNPCSGGVGRDAGQVHPAMVEFDEEQHV